MDIVYLNPKILVPYERNAKKHDNKQVKKISSSIKKYGFKQPVLIDKNNCIVAGHARVLGALKLKLERIPCLVSNDLTDDQVKEYRLLDNKLNESEWDLALLNLELPDVELPNLDFADVGVNFIDIAIKENEGQAKIKDYKQTKNLENHFKEAFRTLNEWGIPELNPYNDDLSDCKFISFGEKASIIDFESTVIHFYIDDYKFNTLWANPDKYIDMFLKCKAIISPDFSNYTDMPKAMHLWSQYKRQWLSKYWQERGVNVISSLSYGERQVFDFSFIGIPQGTICATSFVANRLDKENALIELKEVLKIVSPSQIYIKTAERWKEQLLKICNCKFIEPYKFKGYKHG